VGGRRTRWGRGRRGEVKGVDQKSVDSRDECNWAALRGDVCVCVCVCVCVDLHCPNRPLVSILCSCCCCQEIYPKAGDSRESESHAFRFGFFFVLLLLLHFKLACVCMCVCMYGCVDVIQLELGFSLSLSLSRPPFHPTRPHLTSPHQPFVLMYTYTTCG
jgi:hypothetical protein